MLTITVDLTLTSALALGLIVLVRTFLSFSLEIERGGTLPWRRAAARDDSDSPANVGSPLSYDAASHAIRVP